MAPRGMNVFCCQCGKHFNMEPDQCDYCGCSGFQHKSPAKVTDWQMVAVERAFEIAELKEKIEDLEAEIKRLLQYEPSEVFVRRMRDEEWKGR